MALSGVWICFLSACGGKDEPTGSATVGGPEQTESVEFSAPNGASIAVPAGALREPVTLRIAADSAGAPALPAGTPAVSAMHALTPHGSIFGAPVRVRLPYSRSALPVGADPVVLRAEPGGEWELLEPSSTSDTSLEVETRRFSFFVVVPRPGWPIIGPALPALQTRIVTPAPGNWNTSIANNPPTTVITTPADVELETTLISPTACAGGWQVRFGTLDFDEYRSPGQRSQLSSAPNPRDTSFVATLVSNNRYRVVLPWSHFEPANGLIDQPVPGFPTLSRSRLVFIEGPLVRCNATGAHLGVVATPREFRVFAQTGARRIGIGRQPASAGVLAGQFASFEVQVIGTGPGPVDNRVRVEWMRAAASVQRFVPLGSTFSLDQIGNTHRVTLPTSALDHGAQYRAVACLIDNSAGLNDCVESAAATLSVTAVGAGPLFLQQPRAVMVLNGQAATFTANATGLPMPVVGWETRPANSTGVWTAISSGSVRGTSNSSYTTALLTLADNGTQFRAKAFSNGGEEFSTPITVSVSETPVAPQITTDLSAVRTVRGGDATLAVAVRGTEPLSYQWQVNGNVVLGQNAAVLNLQGVQADSTVSVAVSNGAGSASSRSVAVTVANTPLPPPPLTIVRGPVATTVTVGDTATLAVQTSGGAETVNYAWERNGVLLPNNNTPILTLQNIGTADAGRYRVTAFMQSSGTPVFAEAGLTVNPAGSTSTPLAITVQPVGLSAQPGQTALFAVAASGSGTLGYQWYREGVAITGATQPVLTLSAVATADAGNHSVSVSNGQGNVSSNAAGLVVLPTPGAPQFTLQAAAASVIVGDTPRLITAVSGTPTPQCLWLRNGSLIAGATDCSGYTLPAVTLADNGSVYTAVAYNSAGAVVAAPAVLTVQAAVPPGIATHPTDQNTTSGGSATFTAVATGTPTPLFHWEFNGTILFYVSSGGYINGTCSFTYGRQDVITSSTLSTLSLSNVSVGCSGASLRLVASATPATATSNPATLTVTPAVPTNALTATKIVAGQERSLVLRPDRSVWAWGRMQRTDGTVQYSNLLAGNQALRPVRMYPTVLTDVRAISGWFSAFWALKGEPGTTSSRVLHWGRANAGSDGRGGDGNGSLGRSIPVRDNEVTPVEVLERVGNVAQPVDRVCAIAGGGEQLAMIRAISNTGATTDCNAGSAKTVWFVGSLLARNYESTGVAFAMPGLPTNSPPATLFTGQTTSGSPGLAIALEDGRVFGLGANPYGGFGVAATGSGIIGDLSGPLQLPTTWGSPRSFGMSFYYSLFVVRADGSVMTSGYDNTGELGLGSVIGGSTLSPRPVLAESCTSLPCADLLTGVTSIVGTTSGATLALKNGQILAWGARDTNGLRGPGVTANQPFPRSLPSTVTGFTALSASNVHALVIGPGNVVYAWGSVPNPSKPSNPSNQPTGEIKNLAQTAPGGHPGGRNKQRPCSLDQPRRRHDLRQHAEHHLAGRLELCQDQRLPR